jgi:hypothetical protein
MKIVSKENKTLVELMRIFVPAFVLLFIIIAVTYRKIEDHKLELRAQELRLEEKRLDVEKEKIRPRKVWERGEK